MFEKTLQDLVKGIRSAKADPSIFISQAIAEIKNELKSTDPFIKSQAIRKLTYLHMLGYDMSWAAFHVVEVMSYDRFAHKRIGYIAACQSFSESTDVVLLCTNLLKKEFGSTNEYEVGLAINCLANIVTPDLARDLLGDVVAMMGSARPYVRKKAILVLYKIFLKYPQGLRLTFDHLKDRMEDPDISVVSCAVNVICELANKKPQNYLRLAPNFFRLLTTSSNNWMLIKVVKLMASLVPEEPRLARKLLEPLATIIQNTPAKSLLYECISTVTTALMYTKKSDGCEPRNVPSVVKLCNDQLRQYIEDPDQNLKYLGLVGLGNLMRSHPYVLMEHQEVILECLGDDDITIRMRALDLVSGMVSQGNLIAIVRKLMHHAMSTDGHYRDELINKVLDICGSDRYQNVEDFAWYIQVLVDLAHLQGARHGQTIAVQLIDIAVRVASVRAHAVRSMIPLLMDESALNAQGKGTMAEVLYAAVWITGEFSASADESDESEEEEDLPEMPSYLRIADAMLQPRTAQLPGHVQAAYIQNLLKIVAAAANSNRTDNPMEECQAVSSLIIDRIGAFMQSPHVEVQERACSLRQILIALGLGIDALPPNERAAAAFDSAENDLSSLDTPKILASYFEEALGPVNPKAQRKVPAPEGLDLEKPFNREETRFLEAGPQETSDDIGDLGFQQHAYNNLDFTGEDEGYLQETGSRKGSLGSESDKMSTEAAERDYELQRERLRQDPFYLSSNKNHDPRDVDVDSIPMVHLDDDLQRRGSSSKKKKGKKSRDNRYSVNTEEIMPEGARSSDDDRAARRKSKSKKEVTGLEDVDLITPLREDERIPDGHLYHRQNKEEEEKKKHKKSKHKKRDRDTDDKKKRSKSETSSSLPVEDRKSREKSSKSRKDSTGETKESKRRDDKKDSERKDEKKSKAKKKSSSKEDGESSKSKKRSKEKSRSKKENQDDPEPLLIF